MANDLHRIQDSIMNSARKMREEGTEILPMVFFLTPHKSIPILPLDMEKDQWHGVIQRGIAATNAEGVVMVSEAYVLKSHSPADMSALMAGMSVQEMPGHVEMIMARLETRTGETRDLHAQIYSDGRVGEIEQWETGETTGRLTHFFPQPNK